jgi:hypothetical protein
VRKTPTWFHASTSIRAFGLAVSLLHCPACETTTVGEAPPGAAPPTLPLLINTPQGVRAVGPGQPAEGTVLNATHAAWTPGRDRIIYATPGPEPRLVVAPWPLPPARNGNQSPAGTVLSLPPVRTALNVDWKWSASPDGRRLFVQRFVSEEHYWPHGLDAEHRDAEREVNWVGFVDLPENKASAMPPQAQMTYLRAGIVGWKDGRALFQTEPHGRLLAVDPTAPARSETLLEKSGSIDAVSPTGSHVIVYDGSDGNVTVTLHELGRVPGRVLLSDPFWDPVRRRGRDYAKAAGAIGSFSPDGKSLAVVIYRHVQGTSSAWDVTVELQNLDGSEVRYRDRFTLPEERSFHIAPYPGWSPSGPARFAYWKARADRPPTLVVVNASGAKAAASEIEVDPPPMLRQYALSRLVWSPDGMLLAWPDEGRNLVVFDIATRHARSVFKLSEDASGLRWSAERVSR